MHQRLPVVGEEAGEPEKTEEAEEAMEEAKEEEMAAKEEEAEAEAAKAI